MNAGKQWSDLCQRYDQANKDVNDAWALVIEKLTPFAEGISDDIPTLEELERLDQAKVCREAIDRNMRTFMKAHFGVGA
jgi:hypothetical protein